MRRHFCLVAGSLLAIAGFALAAQRASAQSPQPTLPSAAPSMKPASPVVEQLVDNPRPPLTVRKVAQVRRLRRHRTGRLTHVPRDLDRPALAGVELVAPLPPAPEPPHVIVPLPAYPLDAIAASLTTPPPPVICHRTRRDPDAPDPRLYREVPVECEPDNP